MSAGNMRSGQGAAVATGGDKKKEGLRSWAGEVTGIPCLSWLDTRGAGGHWCIPVMGEGLREEKLVGWVAS
ncbi:hypothetical protein NDU88_005528 [Pleurodeles waltl]|uniref:Uncharacterized protein n=1 Tax=Pleurodeles waltl TaxID=8319 RepID=A0AAV7TCY0_PLEWA|nr:hypothetical protein NDU88_005526 [Pleurodeles waltl]KAJ1173702.1 hypothetical protein NDU88_005528 [Pleurodeles waltl]